MLQRMGSQKPEASLVEGARLIMPGDHAKKRPYMLYDMQEASSSSSLLLPL